MTLPQHALPLRRYLEAQRGRTTLLAKCLHVPVSLVSMWANGVRVIPVERCFQIERWTHGHVRAEGLRPDVSFVRARKR